MFRFYGDGSQLPSWCTVGKTKGACRESAKKGDEQLKSKRTAGDRKGEAATLHALAKLYVINEEPTKAKQPAEAALAILKDLGTAKEQALVTHTLVRAAIISQKIQDAMALAEQLKAQAESTGDREAEVIALNTLAQVFLAKQESSEATQAAEDAEMIAQEIGYRAGEAAAKCTLIEVNLSTGDPNDAEDAARLANIVCPLCKEVAGAEGEAYAFFLTAQARYSTDESAASFAAAKKSVQLFQAAGDRVQQGAAMNLAAAAGLQAGQLDEGKKMATGAMAAFHELGNKNGWASASCLVADIHSAKQDFEQAAWRAEEGAEAFQKLGDTTLEASARLTAAYAYVSRIGLRRNDASEKTIQGLADPAIGLSSRARDLYKGLGNREGELLAANLLANGFLVKGMTGEAEGVANESRYSAKDIGDPVGEANALLTLAQVYFKNKKYEDFDKMVQEAFDLIRPQGDQKLEGRAYGIVRELYESAAYQNFAQGQQAKAEGGGGTRVMNFDKTLFGHGWGRLQDVKQAKKLPGFGYQWVRYMGMRGRPAANMRG